MHIGVEDEGTGEWVNEGVGWCVCVCRDTREYGLIFRELITAQRGDTNISLSVM